jgi:hypothetical protein
MAHEVRLALLGFKEHGIHATLMGWIAVLPE